MAKLTIKNLAATVDTALTTLSNTQPKDKKSLGIFVVAAALSLGACTQEAQESSVHEFDFQTSEEEAAAEVAASNAPMIMDRENSPITPSQDEPENTGAVATTAESMSENTAPTRLDSTTADDIDATNDTANEADSTY
ncbi:hypothetical protein J3492_04780 [Psychrobacter sp. F1192]|uniref:Lipoprotein n=1 Tax=Psychrobacter coccoides TaxID=2818440 RepID=A0ABS3NM92_9GAMM|nr:hypothetical protein [Psychrobacter coccoides]MBO1530525.1 hypothetical protein [Psychrobacter coccoides]